MIFASFGNAPDGFIRMAQILDEVQPCIDEEIYAQIGNTKFEFKHIRTVRFLTHDEMMIHMSKASIVIVQGGWGTISEALTLGKKIIAIPRKDGIEHHHPQDEIVRALEKRGCLLGCYDTTNLLEIIRKVRNYNFKPLERGRADIIINKFIASL